MKQDIDGGPGDVAETTGGSGYGDAFGSRLKALVDIGSRALQSETDSVLGRRPGLRTRVGRQYGQTPEVSPQHESWSAQAVSMLRRRPLHGIAAATVAGVIAGLLVWTLINRRR
ncbi:MAG: hypothetical protein ABI831_23710 [Betaproteobacteria bacterium]